MQRQITDLDRTVAADKQTLQARLSDLASLAQQSRALTALRDESGQLRGFSKVAHDITHARVAEEKIQRLNAELESRVVERTAQARSARLLSGATGRLL